MSAAHVQTGHGPERLIAYTDAVVAIAQTLLILPLLESVSEAQAHHLTTSAWLAENGALMMWFLMSFGLVWSLWVSHHQIFHHVERLSQPLQTVNLGWLLGIVFLPIATALLGLGRIEPVQIALYIGSLLFCSLMLALMGWLVIQHPELRGDQPPLTSRTLATSLSMAMLYTIALLLALAVPGLNYLALFILFLMPLLVRWFTPRFRRLGWGA